MRINRSFLFALMLSAAALAISAQAQTDTGIPHLQRQGNATQLIVDGKPFLITSGELSNNAASNLELLEPVWPKLAAANLNTVLVGLSWAQFEPEEGKFDYTALDGVISKARENHLHLVILWFGCWKNGTSSYPPLWVKKDYTRFPRIQINEGKTISNVGPVETLSTFGDATRDADAKAFAALMHHIKEVDGTQHTVLMMQVENEVGVLRDSRDRSPAANRAYAGQVPAELMKYLEAHKDNLIPEFREVWAANGYRKSGTWEQVFGPGKPASLELPVQTTISYLGLIRHESDWLKLTWPSDEIFMAWNYSRFLEAVIKAGKAEYNIPMFVNTWLQSRDEAWPGTYPSGGPLPEVHDIWRAGAPEMDILAPDIHIEYFDDVCERYLRGGNPLFIPETSTNAPNALMAVGKFNTIGFSPFGVDSVRPIPPELATAYSILNQLAPLILAHQGTDGITAVRMRKGDAPKKVSIGDYTLTLTYTGRNLFLPVQLRGGVEPSPRWGLSDSANLPPVEAVTLIIASGPDEFYFAGGGVRVDFSANTPGPQNVGLGDVQEGKFVDGKWVITRRIAGDDDGQGDLLTINPEKIERVQLYRFP
jgi:hypothetical protein